MPEPIQTKTIDQMNDQEKVLYLSEKLVDLRTKLMNISMMYEALLQQHQGLSDEYGRIVKEHGLKSKITLLQ